MATTAFIGPPWQIPSSNRSTSNCSANCREKRDTVKLVHFVNGKPGMFKAIVISKPAEAQQCAVRAVDEGELPEGDVTFKVDYSTINYKDGLAITGKAPVVRKF